MKHSYRLPLILALTSAIMLTACATGLMGGNAQEEAPKTVVPPEGGMTGIGYVGTGTAPEADQKVVTKEINPFRPIVVRVTGSGAPPYTKTLTPTQRKLLAMRAARLDAYRSVAEQVQGVRLTGGSSVSNLLSTSDSFRVFVDAYLRGVRILSTTMQADGSSEAVAEITLDQQFYQAYRKALLETGNVSSAAKETQSIGTECKGAGCGDAQPSMGNNYYMAQ
jgi:hypothetical protein